MSDITTLPDILTWNEPELTEEAVRSAGRQHTAFLANQLAALAARDGGERSTATITELNSLDNATLQYLLSAPETCHRIYLAEDGEREQLWDFLDKVIRLEQYRCGTPPPPGEASWSATGDYELSFDSDGTAQRFSSPCFQGIVIDFCSPYAKHPIVASNFRPAFGDSPPFSEAELSAVLLGCYAALDGLSYTVKSPADFVTGVVKTIMPRKDIANYTFKGSSNRGIIGRINLINPHLEEVSDGVIASSILHEAIHVYLYHLEEQALLIPDENFAYEARIQSPWSLKQIHPRAYLHASFVWYALYQFWLAPEMATRFHPAVRDYFLQFCARGFRQGESFKRLLPFESYYPEPVFQALQTLTERMAGNV